MKENITENIKEKVNVERVTYLISIVILCIVTLVVQIVNLERYKELYKIMSEQQEELAKYELATNTDAINITVVCCCSNKPDVSGQIGLSSIGIEEAEEDIYYESSNASNTYSEPVQTQDTGVLTASKGVNYNANGNKETYYNLDMSGVVSNAQAQGIEGEYWVRDDGVKMYGDKVIVAANLDVYPRGTVVETSLGPGIVLDTGGFASSNPTQLDIAVDW